MFTFSPDKSGAFTAELPVGFYNVLVAAPGFKPFCKTIVVKAGIPIVLTVRLGPDSENMETD